MQRAVVLALLTACGAHHAPTITGAELYAQLPALQRDGRAQVGAITVSAQQYLITNAQMFLVSQITEHCRGGEPTADVDCALALVLDQRFQVVDQVKQRKQPVPDGEDRSGSAITAASVGVLALIAVGGLTYGIATCDFAGCKAVFGLPLVFVVGGALLYGLGAH